MIDIIMPTSSKVANECLATARTLGMTGVCFISPKFTLPSPEKISVYSATHTRTPVPLCIGIGEQQLTSETDILFNIEPLTGNDRARNKESGLTPALVAKMKQKNVALGFSLTHLFSANEQPQHFGRITQNIKLARNAKIPIVVASLATTSDEMRAPQDIRSLFTLLGLNSQESKQSISLAQHFIEQNIQAEGKAHPSVNIQKV